MEVKRCTVVGDDSVGKTCLLFKMKDDRFNIQECWRINIFEEFDVETRKQPVQKLNFTDTTSLAIHSVYRSSIYENVHVILLCYAIDDINTFRNLKNWLEEIRAVKLFEGKIVLVGTKSDLRRQVTFEMAQGFRVKHNLDALVECSAATNVNICAVLDIIKKLCRFEQPQTCCKIQ